MISTLSALDASVLGFLYSLRGDVGISFFLVVTQLGHWITIFGLASLLAVWLLQRRRYADALGLLTSVVGTGILVLFIKWLIGRPRPDTSFQAYQELLNLSFPSAHAALAMAFYGFLMYLLLQSRSTQSRQLLLIILPILIALVGFSRMYLGVHYMTDVLGGFAIGFLLVAISRIGRNRLLAL